MYDRQAYVDNLEFGTTSVADVLANPRDPLYPLIEEKGLPRYPYDLAQAQRLMGEAGWTRGADGIYRDRAGATFDIEVFTKQVSDNSLRRAQVSGDMLRQAGLNTSVRTYPANVTLAEDRKQRSTFKGLFASITVVDEPRAGQQFLTSGIRLDSDGSSVGLNTYRYANPAFDDLFDRYVKTLDPGTRQGLRADIVRYIADQVIVVPIFYSFNIVSQAIAKNVHGPGWVHATQVASGSDIHTWTMD
jgi:ABC-type transport system substrate-binding protein